MPLIRDAAPMTSCSLKVSNKKPADHDKNDKNGEQQKQKQNPIDHDGQSILPITDPSAYPTDLPWIICEVSERVELTAICRSSKVGPVNEIPQPTPRKAK